MNFYLISPPKEHKNFNLVNLVELSKIIKIDFLQLRPKSVTLKKDIEFIKKYHFLFHKTCKENKIKLIVNDDFRIAKKLGFDGVHLGQEDISCKEARNYLGKNSIIGISCNNSVQLSLKAKKDGASYAAFGPMFTSKTKKNKKSLIDLKKFKEKEDKIPLPFTLIGGINHKNIYKIKNLKAKNIAIIDSLWNFKEGPIESAKIFKKTIN
jgi:thiamine-phosphate pyrophosphorylase